MDLLANTMAKQNKVGADDLGWKFHLYHVTWVIFITSIFIFFDWYIALLILSLFGFYFVVSY